VRQLILGFVGLLALAARSAHAQVSDHRGVDSAGIALLRPSILVRVQLPDLGRAQGRVGVRSATEFTLLTDRTSRIIPISAVDTLWVRGRHTRTGAVIGAILGIGAGVFLAELGKGLCEVDCDKIHTIPIALIGGAGGGLLGAAVGSVFHRWRRVFPH
jgi:hypothetical protein